MPRIIERFRSIRPLQRGLLVALAVASLGQHRAQAHKAVTSKYGYNEDIFPIFRDRCGHCHVEGGPAPMSLLTYQDAVPWAESIREELTSEQMPPWYVDAAGPAVKGGHPMSALEIDKILTWASGGTPQGDFSKTPAPTVLHPQWRFGKPDLTLEMASEHTVPPNTSEDTVELRLRTNLADAKWIRAADLLPSTPSLVRDATISLENGPILSIWVSGDAAVAAPSGTAFRLPPGATILARVHYKKSWQNENKAMSDRSTIGLYFTDPPASGREIQSLVIEGSATADFTEPRSLKGRLDRPARVVAVRPTLDQPYGTVEVHAVTPSGTTIPLLLLSGARPEWLRRYWLAEPMELPKGSTVEGSVEPPAVDSADPLPPKQQHTLQVALDYVGL